MLWVLDAGCIKHHESSLWCGVIGGQFFSQVGSAGGGCVCVCRLQLCSVTFFSPPTVRRPCLLAWGRAPGPPGPRGWIFVALLPPSCAHGHAPFHPPLHPCTPSPLAPTSTLPPATGHCPTTDPQLPNCHLQVCDKYDTGFDDPRIGAMFIDRHFNLGACLGCCRAAVLRAVACSRVLQFRGNLFIIHLFIVIFIIKISVIRY